MSLYAGQWNKHAFIGHELKGRTLGGIALSKIGSRATHVAQAMGMNVVASDPNGDYEDAFPQKCQLGDSTFVVGNVDTYE